MAADFKGLRAVLEAGDFRALIGLAEDDLLEAKREPYKLSEPSGRYELAKDVTAFANRDGGHLLIGLATSRLPDRATDVVQAVQPVNPDDFPVSTYRSIIKEYTYPEISGLEVVFVPSSGDVSGIGVIAVPPQHPDAKPFLVKNVVEDGESLKQIVFGYAIRKADNADPLALKDLQRSLRKGQEPQAQRLTRIEEKLDLVLDALSAAGPPREIDREVRDKRMRSLVEVEE